MGEIKFFEHFLDVIISSSYIGGNMFFYTNFSITYYKKICFECLMSFEKYLDVCWSWESTFILLKKYLYSVWLGVIGDKCSKVHLVFKHQTLNAETWGSCEVSLSYDNSWSILLAWLGFMNVNAEVDTTHVLLLWVK